MALRLHGPAGRAGGSLGALRLHAGLRRGLLVFLLALALAGPTLAAPIWQIDYAGDNSPAFPNTPNACGAHPHYWSFVLGGKLHVGYGDVVGGNGNVYRYDDPGWTTITTPAGVGIYGCAVNTTWDATKAVCMIANDYPSSYGGTIYWYDGSTWTSKLSTSVIIAEWMTAGVMCSGTNYYFHYIEKAYGEDVFYDPVANAILQSGSVTCLDALGGAMSSWSSRGATVGVIASLCEETLAHMHGRCQFDSCGGWEPTSAEAVYNVVTPPGIFDLVPSPYFKQVWPQSNLLWNRILTRSYAAGGGAIGYIDDADGTDCNTSGGVMFGGYYYYVRGATNVPGQIAKVMYTDGVTAGALGVNLGVDFSETGYPIMVTSDGTDLYVFMAPGSVNSAYRYGEPPATVPMPRMMLMGF